MSPSRDGAAGRPSKPEQGDCIMANDNLTLAGAAGARQSSRAGGARARQTPPPPVSEDGDEDMSNPSPTLILTKLGVENYDRLLEHERTGRPRAGKPRPARRLWPWLVVLGVLAVGVGILGALTGS